jgi:hypothetical protein
MPPKKKWTAAALKEKKRKNTESQQRLRENKEESNELENVNAEVLPMGDIEVNNGLVFIGWTEILKEKFDELTNPDVAEAAPMYASLDLNELNEMKDLTIMLSMSVICARFLQIIYEKNLRIGLTSPAFFENDLYKDIFAENPLKCCLMKPEFKERVLIPIFQDRIHFTLAICEFDGRNVEINFYDSFGHEIKPEIQEKLIILLTAIYGNEVEFNLNIIPIINFDAQRGEGVNCAAFTASYGEQYLIDGRIVNREENGFEKRFRLRNELAKLFEIPEISYNEFFNLNQENDLINERKRKHADTQQRYRERLGEEENNRRNREYVQNFRENLGEEENNRRNREYVQNFRENLGEEENNRRNQEYKQRQRDNLNEEEMETNRETDRISHQVTRNYQTLELMDITEAPHLNSIPIENIAEHYLGKMSVKCNKCKGKHFRQETNKNGAFSSCCSQGKIIFKAPTKPFPNELKQLFIENDEESKMFSKNIRQLNKSLALGSIVTKEIRLNGAGPYTYRQLGEFQRAFNENAMPEEDEAPSYGQLYMIEADAAQGIRVENNKNLNVKELNLMKKLADLLKRINDFAKAYEMLKDEMEKAERQARLDGTTAPAMKLLFSIKPNTDQNRYNMPRTNDVAAVYVEGPNGEAPPAYIVVHEKNGRIRTLNPLDASVEPMTYPLFYPNGEKGWNFTMKIENQKVTLNKYLHWKLTVRDEEDFPFCPIKYGGKLFQEWLVDQYLKMDYDRLMYHRKVLNEKIVTAYDAVDEQLQQRAIELGAEVGKKIILPSTYIGSPRYMSEAYDDAMASVRVHGKPDLFITMTCNPNWREIQEQLEVGQTASDRPDIVARVFNLKYKALIKYITESKIFGEVASYTLTIEFQKRGLPHVHIIITLKMNSKLVNEEEIDRVIRAEIPNQETEPRLYEIITTNNMHQCTKLNVKGQIKQYMPCCSKENLSCKKRFPKEFRDFTEHGDGGYAKYRRRNDGRTVIKNGGQILDNRYVVPFSPQLSLKFNCHINVEHVADIEVVKYLHKYIFKGPDAAIIKREFYDPTDGTKKILDYNEIDSFLNCRYLSAPEAAWRIFNFEIVNKNYSVERLDIHLPGKQNVFLEPTATTEEIKKAKDNKKSKLMAFFELNSELENEENIPADHPTKNLKYLDVPRYFTWHKKEQKWKIRKAHFNTIGRIYNISPKMHELFHLRLLILNVESPKNFEEYRTVNGTLYTTFKEACLAMGLITDDEEYINAMKEAAVFKMPAQLRFMYAMLLIHCKPTGPQRIYDEFIDDISADFIRRFGRDKGIKLAYNKIEQILIRNGTNFRDFEMEPSFEINEEDLIDVTLTQPDTSPNELTIEQYQELGQEMYETLNEDQKKIVDELLEIFNINELRMNCNFIDGPGGTGKTFIYKTLYNILKGMDKNVINMAYTGIAATLLPKGKTIHGVFALGINITPETTSGILKGTKAEKVLKETHVFIIDEASMVSKDILKIMDQTLREVMNSNVPFGGKLMLFGGDFRQTLPIKEKATPQQLIQLSLKGSDLWKDFKIFKLTKNMRADANQIEFANEILKIGEGKLNDNEENVKIPEQCIFNGNLLKEIFAKKINDNNICSLQNRAILAPTNLEVDEINLQALNLIEGEEKIYYSVDEIREQDNAKHRYMTELLHTIDPNGIPKHELKLKKNAIVMLMRNLDIESGLCNGTRFRILEMRPNMIYCKIISGDKSGQDVFIPRITLECSKNLPVTFYRKQFPLRLALAMTINKSQGQTLDKVGLKLDKVEVFSHGQLYVGISRVKNYESLKIKLKSEAEGKTKNIVHRAVL